MRQLVAALGLVLAACVASTPPTSLAPSTTPMATPSAIAACLRRDSVPRVSSGLPFVRPARQAVEAAGFLGRVVLVDSSNGVVGRTLTIYERGNRTVVELPASVVGYSTPHLSAEGLVSALVAHDTVVTIWSHDTRTGATRASGVDVPLPGQLPDLHWTPDGRTVAFVPDAEVARSQLFLVDLAGQARRLDLPEPYLYGLAWRSNTELSVVVGRGPTYPLDGAKLLTWDKDAGFVQLVPNLRAQSPLHSWSSDGTSLIYSDSAPDAPAPARLLRRKANGTNVIFGATDLQRLANGCDLSSPPGLSFFGFGWSPDSNSFASIGKMPPSECCWFLATGSVSGGTPALFRAPSNCYLNGEGGWLDNARIVIELTGPDCGRTPSEARAVIIDASSGSALTEFPVGRKSTLRLSPDRKWVASVYDGATDFIPIADPAKRIVLPLSGSIIGWCCQ